MVDEVLVYGAKDEIKKDPPTIIIEIYDQDKVGKSEFIGRAIARPRIKLRENPYITPSLEWFEITRGIDGAGELLAAFEMLEVGSDDLPKLTEPKYILPVIKNGIYSFKKTCYIILYLKIKFSDKSYTQKCSILPVPRDVRPNLSKFRIEVLFWGLRDLKRVHFMSVDKPRIDVECSGTILSSSIIQNAKKNPNFPNMLKFFDLELPVEETYAPPITIRCVDCRSFGRYTLVGTHQITSIHKYMHRPLPKEDLKNYTTMGGQIILAAPTKDQPDQATTPNKPNDGSNENLTLYGAACVAKT